jgi:serine/alanine adding enzyme
MNKITIVNVTDAQQEGLWDRFVTENPNAAGYHLVAWRHVVSNAFGHQSFYLMAQESTGQVRGILPLVFLRSLWFGRFLVSLPYFNYAGLLADSREVGNDLLTKAQEVGRRLGASHIELRHVGEVDLNWQKKEHKVSMRLNLPQRYEDLIRGFPSKLRSQVRRGEKEGMKAEIGGLHLLEAFYEVFARNMRDLGTPVCGMHFFAQILENFAKDATIIVVRHKAKAVAAAFLYGFRHKLEIPWAASDRRFARLAPNMMLYGEALRYACEQGYRVFDFGRSTIGSSTYRFKEQWGAKPVQLNWYYWLPNGGPLPELNPQNPKYQLAIRVWQRLPVSLTQILGPKIVKYLP